MNTFDFNAIGPDDPAGRVLRSVWQPVYIAEKLPQGKAVPLRILGEDFTLYRGASGQPYVVASRCAHRAALLSTAWVEGDEIRCIYHGWRYDGAGQCTQQPAEKRNFADRVKIGGWPAREHLGLIFVYFGQGEPPDLVQLDAYSGSGGFVEAKASERAWPFFNQLENSVDEVHFNFTHRKSCFSDAGLNDVIPDIECEETEYGILRIGRRGDVVRTSHIIMPNCMYSMVVDVLGGWTEHLAWRVPIDEASHVTFGVNFIHRTGADRDAYFETRKAQRARMQGLESADDVIDRILRGEMHLDDVPDDRPDLLLIQDGVVMKGQGLRRNRTTDALATSDRQVVLLRRLWISEMQAAMEGRKGKQWRAPRDLVPTTGAGAEAD